MRTVTRIETACFTKPGEDRREVKLPHTWNNLDGQDGGYDYFRGQGTYEIKLPDPTKGKHQVIQFDGANHIAEVFCNGVRVGEHSGGFSSFRFDLSCYLRENGNLLTVIIDNKASDIYPQQADFTFFGGLYRDVFLIETGAIHFDLTKAGSDGVFITAKEDGMTQIDSYITLEDEKETLPSFEQQIQIFDVDGRVIAEKRETLSSAHMSLCLKLDDPILWDGRENPTLYRAVLSLKKDDALFDQLVIPYGYRSFSVDPEKGFFLNHRSYPLHGVSRHQDREDMGWAITEKEHREDMELICDIGANAIRLAHYQQSRFFYDLCDQKGMVVWAEIPFITQFLPSETSYRNTLKQLEELILQNYNHPSICFWGISNEITGGGETEALLKNLYDLQALAKRLDPDRLTTMAHLHSVEYGSEVTNITDVNGYNVYLGWYDGELTDNGPFLDHLHSLAPDRPLALSEYGVDASPELHSAAPRNHDYTEEYQCVYHEALLRCVAERPYLWGTFVWNMFDFAADARNEGGSKGRNNKGLVTYDRRIRKDAFYLYQAYWTKEPLVHICGKRFADRGPQERRVRVYTNCDEITMLVNGQKLGSLPAQAHCCLFENVPMELGDNTIEAVSETGARDATSLRATEQPNLDYQLPEDVIVAGDWFDHETGETLTLEFPGGKYSIKNTFGELLSDENTKPIVIAFLLSLQGGGQAAEPAEESALDDAMKANLDMMQSVSVERIIKMVGQALTPKDIVCLNRKLNAYTSSCK